MVFSNFNGDQRGPGLATFIATGTGESIVVDDATLPRRENGKPRLEVLSKYVVFGFGMWLKFPDCFLGCGHGSKTLGYQTRLRAPLLGSPIVGTDYESWVWRLAVC